MLGALLVSLASGGSRRPGGMLQPGDDTAQHPNFDGPQQRRDATALARSNADQPQALQQDEVAKQGRIRHQKSLYMEQKISPPRGCMDF